MAYNNLCIEHTGCMARIKNIEKENKDQWAKMSKLDDRIDTILTRVNIILGSIAASCILLVLNLIAKVMG